MSPPTGANWGAIAVLKRGDGTAVEFITFDGYDAAITLRTADALLNALLNGIALEGVSVKSDRAYRAYYGPLRMYYFAAADRAFVVDSGVVYRLGTGAEAARNAELALHGAEEELAAAKAFLKAPPS